VNKTTQLVLDLKEKNEDFEFYPTSKEMIEPINKYMERNWNDKVGDLLDIGAGTCNFKKYYNQFGMESDKRYSYYIGNYQVIEKSQTLIDMFSSDVVVIGTDFNMVSLFDKKVDTIFSNPPYTQYEEWTKRIIYESTARRVFMIIPKRWKNNKEILSILKKTSTEYEILGEFDFLEADRKARAYVDVVVFKKRYNTKNFAFDDWFDKEFGNNEAEVKEEKKEKKEKFKNQLAKIDNKVDFFVDCYNEDLKVLEHNYKAVTSLDAEILLNIGINIDKVKESLKENLSSLKNKYWKCVFEELQSVRSKLTEKYRSEMLSKFTNANSVDFNHANIYNTILWILKNVNKYYDKQIIDLYEKLSDSDNVTPYKSNQNTFQKERWRWNRENCTHYTLDYRLVCSRFNFHSYTSNTDERKIANEMNDICVVAENLGFLIGEKEIATTTRDKYYIYQSDGKELFEYKIFKNGNTHIKMNIEFSKAFNVEAARLLGWIKDKSDISKEFNHTHLKGSEKYFKANLSLPLNKQLLLN